MNCTESRKLISAYLDHELDIRTHLALETHITSCELCKQALARNQSLHAAISNPALYHRAPEDLHAKILASLVNEAKPPKTTPAWRQSITMPWWSFGVSLASMALVTMTLFPLISAPSKEAKLNDELVSSHIRSLMGEHLADVISTDQHTVKPWFAGKLDYSPPVSDFSTQGYPLIGGRLDYIQHRTVSTLVYRHNKHIINVSIWPDTSRQQTSFSTLNGYHLLKLYQAGMVYWIVSDLNQTEIETFAKLL